MTKQVKRLSYTDSNNDLQVLGVLKAKKDDVPGYSGKAAATINNIKVNRSLRGFNTVKVWATNEVFGSIPIKTSDFGGDEPEIFLEHYDTSTSSWVREFRGYAENQGSISDSGEVAFKLYSFAKYTGKVNADQTAPVTSNTADAFQALLPSGYQVEVPGSVTPPSVNSYTLVAKRSKGYRELSKDHQWAYRFTPRTDGSGNYIVRFEPEGFGGTVGNIRGREDFTDGDILAKQVKSWEKARTKDIVNKVEVIGKDNNNSKVVGTASDSQSITDYGERFKRFQIDYTLGGTTEADNIADDKLKLSPGEGGEIKIDTFHESNVNDSFDVKDTRRGIDGVYTCTEQETFYPEGNDMLVFTYETETEKRAAKDEQLGSERNKVYPDGSTTVQTGNASPGVNGDSGSNGANVSGNAGDNNADVSGFSGGSDPSVDGETDKDASTDVIDQTTDTQSFTNYFYNSGTDVLGGTFFVDFDDIQGAVAMVSLVTQPQGTPSSQGDLQTSAISIRAVNTDENIEVPNGSGLEVDKFYYSPDSSTFPAKTSTFTFYIPGNHAGDELEVQYEIDGGAGPSNSTDVAGEVSWYTIDQHSHGATTGLGTLQAANHGHDSNTYEADDHDHDEGSFGADTHPHGDGTYEADTHDHGSSSVQTATEEKTSR